MIEGDFDLVPHRIWLVGHLGEEMRRVFLVLVDTALLFGAALTATRIRFGSDTADVLMNRRGLAKVVMLTVVIQLAFYLFDLYDLPAGRAPVELRWLVYRRL